MLAPEPSWKNPSQDDEDEADQSLEVDPVLGSGQQTSLRLTEQRFAHGPCDPASLTSAETTDTSSNHGHVLSKRPTGDQRHETASCGDRTTSENGLAWFSVFVHHFSGRIAWTSCVLKKTL